MGTRHMELNDEVLYLWLSSFIPFIKQSAVYPVLLKGNPFTLVLLISLLHLILSTTSCIYLLLSTHIEITLV